MRDIMQTQPLSGEVYAVHPDLLQPVLCFIAIEVEPGVSGGWLFPPVELSRGEMMERMLNAFREQKHVHHYDPDETGVYLITVLPIQWDSDALIDSLDAACGIVEQLMGS
jgi:hypothetical protein